MSEVVCAASGSEVGRLLGLARLGAVTGERLRLARRASGKLDSSVAAMRA